MPWNECSVMDERHEPRARCAATQLPKDGQKSEFNRPFGLRCPPAGAHAHSIDRNFPRRAEFHQHCEWAAPALPHAGRRMGGAMLFSRLRETTARGLPLDRLSPRALRRGIACMFAMLAAFLVGACSNILVHDSNRDKQGQEAKKLVAEARVGDTVAALEKSFSEVAALEEARARDRAAYLFDLQVKVVSRASSLTSKFTENAKDTDGLQDRKSTRLNSSHSQQSRMPSSA